MSADSYASISKIIPLSKALQRLTVTMDGVYGTLSVKLSNRMIRKFSGIEENHLFASSTPFDPRMKKLAFTDATAGESIAGSLGAEAAHHTTNDSTHGGPNEVPST